MSETTATFTYVRSSRRWAVASRSGSSSPRQTGARTRSPHRYCLYVQVGDLLDVATGRQRRAGSGAEARLLGSDELVEVAAVSLRDHPRQLGVRNEHRMHLIREGAAGRGRVQSAVAGAAHRRSGTPILAVS